MSSVEENSFPVVCIQEHRKANDNPNGKSKIDTTLFFIFDARYDEYVLWGKRGVKTDDPFMFRFSKFKDMYNCINICLLHYNDAAKFSIMLYNYNNFPIDYEVSYDFLYDNMDQSHEITGTDYIGPKYLTKSYLRKLAHICRYSYNRIDGDIV